ncbi:MAG: serine hydrolase domain-containing protein, partial [Candidatus Hydrogenedentota bacterium]
MNYTRRLLFLLLVPFAVCAAEPDFDAYSAYVTQAMKDWEVPAIAIAVVKDGEVVFAKGFGSRTIGKDEPVDENTLFSIGSITKSFTSGALAILADEGKLKWSDKVLDYMPQFELYDPYVSREFMIEDLLCHRSGLARGDELWYGTTRTRDEIIHQVRNLEPSWSFRSTFGYQNIMFLAAGQLIPAITGTSWDDFVKARIFTPLGMTNSYTSVVPLSNIENVAAPHEKFDGKVAPVPHFNLDNTGPAGSIVSSASQMANWIKLHLAKGEFNGRRIISEANVLEMQKPRTIIPYEGRWADYAPDAH